MNPHLLLAIPMLPLAAAIVAGLGGRMIGRAASAAVTITAVAVSCVLSLQVLYALLHGSAGFDGTVRMYDLDGKMAKSFVPVPIEKREVAGAR